jgi:hypothetical protein
VDVFAPLAGCVAFKCDPALEPAVDVGILAVAEGVGVGLPVNVEKRPGALPALFA